ncbi:MAG TPA: hypothetical protein PKV98_01635 [Burkholderiaceae bacterium]|nr:hypothetical protein [Burkholderiaceae bacterium]
MTPQEEAEARPVIHDFVEWMVWFLDRSIKLDDPFPGFRRSRKRALIRRPDLEALRHAWVQFEEDWRASGYDAKIANLPASQLMAHGLYGAQLAAKMRMVGLQALRIERWYPDSPMPGGSVTQRRWFLYAAPPVTVEQTAPPKLASPGVRPRGSFISGLGKLITRMDVFADSVIEAAGIGGALKEIKELFGMSLDDG